MSQFVRCASLSVHNLFCVFHKSHSFYVSLSVRQLHREFLRAGANVIQTFTFYCSEDKLEISGNVTDITVSGK